MFSNILIATDGSELAAKAVEQGILFAKEIGAKITAVTVTEPFHVLSVSPSQLEYTPIEYKKHAEIQANKVLGTVSAAAKSGQGYAAPSTCADSRAYRISHLARRSPSALRSDGIIGTHSRLVLDVRRRRE